MQNITVKDIIDIFIKKGEPFKASYKIEKNNKIKIRYEYDYNKQTNENKNVFIYLNKINDIIKLYNMFPNNRHFYEIIEDKCKFFLDLDVKIDVIEPYEWREKILLIKYELQLFFKKFFDKEIYILEYKSLPSVGEPKYSCHLVILDYCFDSDDCKIICNIFLNELRNKKLDVVDIIDSKVYGKKRMLRIEGSTKICSNRKKICIYDDIKNKTKDIINLNGLVTNIENTTILKIDKDIISKNIDQKSVSSKNKIFINNYDFDKILLNDNDKRYNYTKDDIMYLKNNIKNIINIINSWHYKKINMIDKGDIFTVLKIENNRMDLKRVKPFDCPVCKRIHERQHAYIFISNKKIMFHCRRADNQPVKVDCNLDNI